MVQSLSSTLSFARTLTNCHPYYEHIQQHYQHHQQHKCHYLPQTLMKFWGCPNTRDSTPVRSSRDPEVLATILRVLRSSNVLRVDWDASFPPRQRSFTASSRKLIASQWWVSVSDWSIASLIVNVLIFQGDHFFGKLCEWKINFFYLMYRSNWLNDFISFLFLSLFLF